VHTLFYKDSCKMVRGAMVLLKGFLIGTLYKLLGNVDLTRCNNIIYPKFELTATQPDSMSTQLNSTRSKSIQTDSTRHDDIDLTKVEGFPECGLEVNICEHFIYGKQSRVRFPSRATRENGILELVHSDVFGPVTVPSLGGSLYYVSFIDDFSMKTWIYFLRNKSEVFERFKELKYLVENQTEKRIKVLRNDNGGEFCGKEFDQFCKQFGIAHINTTPYTPQQNGVVERMNRMLMDKERSMLNGAKLAQEFWEEVVETARYLVNMSPSSTIVEMTPNEVWYGKKPLVAHLKVFVCDAFVHVPKEKRNKLDKKVVKCVFIIYKEGMKGYNI
jgi:hypothetical protein